MISNNATRLDQRPPGVTSEALSADLTQYPLYRYPTVEAAKKASKIFADFTCLFTDLPGNQIDKQSSLLLVGAHLYPAGSFGDIKYFRENIFCMSWRLHSGWPGSFDEDENGLRSPVDRIKFLSRHTHPNHMQRVRTQLIDLMRLLDYKDYVVPNFEEIL